MLALAIAALLSAPPAAVLEDQAAHHVVQQYEQIGRSAPTLDSALSRAARSLAEHALDTSAAEAGEPLVITAAVSDARAHDPSPRAVIIKGSPIEEPFRSLYARTDLADEAATSLGVGVVQRGESVAVAVLLANRRADLAPFPRTLPFPAGPQRLCGELRGELASADLYITRPSGAVEKVSSVRRDAGHFCAGLSFPTQGEYTLEVIGRGPRGPEVAALFFVQVGPSTRAEGGRSITEPTDPEEAREAIRARINALRASNRAGELVRDGRLDHVAQAYAERMSGENFFAHVAPDGEDLRARMVRAGVRYRTAGENLGLAGGPLAAHFGIELSPGHRKNLLEPAYSHLGVGVASRMVSGRAQSIVVEVLADPQTLSQNPLEEAYLALKLKRQALKLPALIRSAPIEQIALDHARRALALDSPKTDLPGKKIHERVFAALDVAAASVDFFVADSPSMITDSKNLIEAQNRLVGIGAVQGDSKSFGKGKYWVVVVYASPR